MIDRILLIKTHDIPIVTASPYDYKYRNPQLIHMLWMIIFTILLQHYHNVLALAVFVNIDESVHKLNEAR